MLTEGEQEIIRAQKVALCVGNPTQLWETYAVMGDLKQAQDITDGARQAYRNALDVIEKVIVGLNNNSRKVVFMESQKVTEIRQMAQMNIKKGT